MMNKLCATVALVGALAVGHGMALAAPATKWPTFDQARLQQIVDAFAAKGVIVCPDEVRNTPGMTGRSAHQTIELYASTRWSSCPQHRSVADPRYNPDEERATYNPEAFLDVDLFTSQQVFDRGVETWKRKSLNWPIVGWSWKPVVLGLNAGYEDVVNAVLKAMKALPGKPRVLFDDS
ncbi:MAG TPA: hypothetical protein VGO28_03085 [Acidimicrobiia bacterium]